METGFLIGSKEWLSGSISGWEDVHTGVLHGSVLGPLLAPVGLSPKKGAYGFGLDFRVCACVRRQTYLGHV